LARRSLKPQLNQIRTWVRQGRTDAWIAHQLEVSVGDIRSFKREHELVAEEEGEEGLGGAAGSEELDLRAEDDALVAAALEAEQEADEDEDSDDDESDDEDEDKPKRRRRGRRGGRGRRRKAQALEGTFDHGEEGYGLWLDPAIQDDPIYAEHWAGHRPVTVTVEAERIIISRAGENGDGDEDDED
jgi:TATA-binding protein-associated factor Taf7